MTNLTSFWEHLEELRKTLFRVILSILSGVIIAFFFYPHFLTFFLQPLSGSADTNEFKKEIIQFERVTCHSQKSTLFTLPGDAGVLLPLENGVEHVKDQTYKLHPHCTLEYKVRKSPFVLTSPIEGFVTSFKVSFWMGFILSSPLWLWFLCQFFLPAMHPRERSLVFPFFLLSCLFISGGALLAYYITLPLVGNFFLTFNEALGENLWTLSSSLEFSLWIILAHCLAFEFFAVFFILVHFGILSSNTLTRLRRYAILGIFILSAILTPPDVLSQLLLAFPLIGLYELLVFYARTKAKKYLLKT